MVTNPKVQYAIRCACLKRARKGMREQVEQALRREGAASLRELMAATGLDGRACGDAVDQLRILGRCIEEPAGVYCWITKGSE